MIAGGGYRPDIATQLQAVESAVVQARRTLTQDRPDPCMDQVVADVRAERPRPIENFKAIARFV